MLKKLNSFNPEIWGGIECTINRVQNTFYDQLFFNGFYGKEEERIGQLASLGITKLRFPVLWEKYQPVKNQIPDFTSAIKSIASLHAHGIEPIITLLHHGSGPAYTSLIDPDFPFLFQQYAKAFANEFPDINFYTPINEPLTTARFSGLYGIWYPHLKNDHAFYRMVLNEVLATSLAMKEIRQLNSNAKFVLTEDLGKIYSTNQLNYQSNFENERRWLSCDLLNGTFSKNNIVYQQMLAHGITEKEIEQVKSQLVRPDIFGFNYYATSERFLDHRLDLYPGIIPGGNGKETYVDVEAFRVRLDQPHGLKVLLEEAFTRYPEACIAITEIHLGSTRDEQLRWFDRIYKIVTSLHNEGKSIFALTAWSIFGSAGWQQLLAGPPFVYEPGIFDTRTVPARETALANLWRKFSGKKNFDHDLIAENGWWERSDRFLTNPEIHSITTQHKRPILITGKNGTLAKAFLRLCALRGLYAVGLDRAEMDITNQSQISTVLENLNPWVVINTAGFVKVDEAEHNVQRCMAENYFGAIQLSNCCLEKNIRFVTFSTDLVFDGNKLAHYIEKDEPSPLNVYGKSKWLAEKEILKTHPDALIIRTSAFFSPWDSYNFLYYMHSKLSEGLPLKVPHDQIISPTYVPDLVNAVLDLIIDNESGIWHLSNTDEVSWADFAKMVADRGEYNSELIVRVTTEELNQTAKRPAYSALSSSRGVLLPDLEQSIDAYLKSL